MKPETRAAASAYALLERPTVRFGLTILICLNVGAFILETTRMATPYARAFQLLELASVAIFTLEYAARLVAARADPRFAKARAAPLRWAITPLAIVDALAILPTLVGIGDLRVLRALRLLRLLKLGRYNAALQLLGRVLRRTQAQLVATLFLVGLALILTSCFLYYAEHDAQPDEFGSIPASMWWAIATLTTTGYGDAAPITAMGRLLAGATTIIGISVVALPVGILASAFVEEIKQRRGETGGADRCPHCGEIVAPEAN